MNKRQIVWCTRSLKLKSESVRCNIAQNLLITGKRGIQKIISQFLPRIYTSNHNNFEEQYGVPVYLFLKSFPDKPNSHLWCCIRSYCKKHVPWVELPSWMTIEICSRGSISSNDKGNSLDCADIANGVIYLKKKFHYFCTDFHIKQFIILYYYYIILLLYYIQAMNALFPAVKRVLSCILRDMWSLIDTLANNTDFWPNSE